MLPLAALALLVRAIAATTPHDTLAAAPDSVRPVVRTFSPLLVHAAPFDPGSTQSIQRAALPPAELPVDDYRAAFRARPGVVLDGTELHVRGGRAGELAYELDDLPLVDPLRGAPLAVPLLALESETLLDGGLEAQHAGALAGVLALVTAPPPPRVGGRVAWQSDGGASTRFDRVQARLGGPLLRGVGAAATVEATLDDGALPALRSEGRHPFLGLGRFGWRADNHLLAHVIVARPRDPDAPAPAATGLRFEALAGRIVEQPYDRMFTLDGYVAQLTDSVGSKAGPAFFPMPAPGAVRYRAADHLALTDTRQLAWLATWARPLGRRGTAHAALVAVRVDRLTSVGGRSDPGYVTAANAPEFGLPNWPTSDPFDVYGGDDPVFRRSRSDRVTGRAEWVRPNARGGSFRTGVELFADHVRMFELDGMAFGHFEDSLRTYDATAPGGAAWVQSRIVFEGLVANLGARLGWFSPGAAARAQSLAGFDPPHDHLALAPRLGLAFPVGTRDAVAFSYTRVDEDPARDFLYDGRRGHVSNRQPVGNPGLVPAEVRSYELAEKHAFDERSYLQAGYFYRDLYGLVGTVWEPQPGFVARPTYENAGNGHASGVEVTLARRFPLGVRAQLSYTYANAVGPTSLEEGVRFGIPLDARPPAIADAPLDWDRRSVLGLELVRDVGAVTFAWTTVAASGAPWTPHDPRTIDADLSRLNARRLPWSEETDAQVTWAPPRVGARVRVRVEARNLFDHRGPVAATVPGDPNPLINTEYDDYGAYRTTTGQGGGAYRDDVDGDDVPDWVPVNDPRLSQAPRTVRWSLAYRF